MSAVASEGVRERQETSPQVYARLCGALYLYIGVAGMFAEIFVRSKLIDPGDAAVTAANITANEFLFRIGFSGELLHLMFDVMVAALLYVLLRPVNRTIALMAAFFRLVSDVILAVASISHFAALRLLAHADYLATFQPEQLQTLALLALKLHGDGYSISLGFFGFACLTLGYVIYRSTYLPRTVGVLMTIAGASYLLNSFAVFLAPAIAGKLFPFLFGPIVIAEMTLALWLLVKGVDVPKWQAVNAALRRSG
jgi:hypothetical protein